MKLSIHEVFFLLEAAKATNIKAVDAPIVSNVLSILQKEFERLKSIEEKDATPKE